MKIKTILNIITIIFCSTLNAQIQSNNKNEGLVISNSITIKGNDIYACGGYNGKVKINNSTLNGETFNTPFITKYNLQNNSSNVILPVKALNGFAEFKYIYSFNDEIYIAGSLVNKMIIDEDTVGVNNEWTSFIIKLNDNDSIDWYQIFKFSENCFSPSLLYHDNSIFSIFQTETIDKDSASIFVNNININDGSSNWNFIISNYDKLYLIGSTIINDSLILFYSKNGTIFRNLYEVNGDLITSNSIISLNEHSLNYLNNENKHSILSNKKVNNKFDLNLTSNVGNQFYSNKILSADYFGSAEVILIEDSIYSIIGFFQGTIYNDTFTTDETDTSNSFLITYNFSSNNIINFEILPYRNIFKTFITDSTIYYISNYVDGLDEIKRSFNSTNNHNSDFKVTFSKIKRKNQKTNNSLKPIVQNLKIYPNSNNGKEFTICCKSKEEIYNINLYNNIGQTFKFNLSYKGNEIKITPIEELNSGIYFIEFIDNENNSTTLKFVVN